MEPVKNSHVPNCDELHNIVFIGNRAIISVNEFYKIIRHWEKNVEKICGEKFQKTEKCCMSHRHLNFVKMLKESVLKRNKDQNKTIKIFKMELLRDCQQNICMNNWCFNIHKKKLQLEFSKDSYQTVLL